jgi:hypothetical protein
MTGAAAGAGNGTGIGLGEIVTLGAGLGKFTRGFDCCWIEAPGLTLGVCAVATVTGAMASRRMTRALASDRMMKQSDCCPAIDVVTLPE